MASYHFSAQIVKRSEGRSAIAAAAYRSGDALRDERNAKTFDFRRRRGVVHSEVLAPDGCAPFLRDREKLWNHVERMEKRSDAQLAREINLTLPHELDAVRRRETLLKFVREAFVDRGMVADVAIHAPVPEKGDDPRNHHAHIMLSMRRATSKGLHPVKTREWNSDVLLDSWRALWALRQNEALECAGLRERVDHRSLLVQKQSAVARRDFVAATRLDRKPQIHIGPKAAKAAKRGRSLPSADRRVGPARRRGIVVARRLVRYTAIDQGTRSAHRATILRANWLKAQQRITKWRERAVRFRVMRLRAAQIEALSRANFRYLFRQRQQWRWLERRDVPHSLQGQVERAAKELLKARHRRRLMDSLLAEVDRTLAGLLLSQARGTKAFLRLQSNNPQAPALRPGRSRARYPIGPSIPGQYNV